MRTVGGTCFKVILKEDSEADAIKVNFEKHRTALREMLEDYDTAVSEKLDELLVEFEGRPIEQSLKEIKRLISNYDFDGALELLIKTKTT